MQKVIITLVGPTCSGKTTLKDQLLATGDFIEVISHTTRPMRNGEVNGETYHFVTPEQFDEMEFLERIEYNGNIYGGSVAEFEKGFDSGQIPVIIVEPNGNAQININAKKLGWTVINVWVGCPVGLQAERLVTRLIEDYRAFIQKDGEMADYNKIVKEYVGRLTMVQTVESEWPDLFKKSVRATDVAPGHYVADHIPEVMTIPEFTQENEADYRENLINYAKQLANKEAA